MKRAMQVGALKNIRHRMQSKHTYVRTVSKYNPKIEIEAKTIPINHSHMHYCSLSLLGTGTCTSIKSVGGKLVKTNTKYTLINRQS